MAVGVTFSTTISSSRNPLVRHAIRLRDNRFRQKQRAVIVDGIREIERAMDGGLLLQTLFIAQSTSTLPRDASAEQQFSDQREQAFVKKAGDAVIRLTDDLMAQVAYGGNPREAVAIFSQPDDRTLGKLVLGDHPLVIVMVGVEKPGNAGAIFRSADAVGADAVVLCEASCDLFNPNLIRSSLGTVFTVPCAEANQVDTLAWLGDRGLTSYAAIVGAQQTMWEVDYRGPSAIVVGSEALGLGPLWCDNGNRNGPSASKTVAVSIPMLGAADSLNVSVTAAALLFEARRQRIGASHK